ncbi:MAG TPA: EAL domain-containing protein [Burkholderiales bacterium]|nr:EAL domain-containing protein [Burkholderiales bacterium]
MRGVKLYHQLRPFIAPLVILVLVSILIFVIFFTVLEWQWVAFLSGILSASILSMVSRAAKSEWRVTRRTAQVNKLREKLLQESVKHVQTAGKLAQESEARAKEHESLTRETSAHKRAKEELRATQERLQLMSDALPIIAFYCDKNLTCQHHNAAFRTWLHVEADQINGRQLKELLGENAFESMTSFVKEVLTGRKVHLEWSHKFHFALSHIEGDLIPHKNPSGQIIGFFGLFADVTARKQLDVAPPSSGRRKPIQAAHGAQTAEIPEQALYIDSIAEQLTGWGDAAARLAEILEKDELRLYHQLILPLKPEQGHPPIHEILIRLHEEEESLSPPGAFIPIIEHFNLMPAIDRWVVSHVIDWYVRKHSGADTRPAALYSIILSEQSVSDPGFAEYVRKQIESRRFPAQMLCFVISEEEAIARIDDTSRFIATLKPLGCRFVLDGFGSAKVSFEHLKRLPVDFLKVDDSIVRYILRDTVALGKVKAIQQVCNMVGIRTIAEFVENDEILNKVKELGMDYAQGFGIERPKPLE